MRALRAGNVDAVAQALAEAGIAATAVGVRALPYVAPVVAAGIARRAEAGVETPLNLILCENLKGAAAAFRGMVAEHLPIEFQGYLAERIGFVDTVIGRMVPPLNAGDARCRSDADRRGTLQGAAGGPGGIG